MRTPLFPLYAQYGARMVSFHGWELPVQFSGIIDEHLAVRERAGLFDISHMGEIEFTGPGSLALIQKLTVNDASRIEDGQVQYSAMCYPDGGIVDDLTVYRFSGEHFLFCVNAANANRDFAWILEHREGEVQVQDTSAKTALLALQGPLAERIIKPLSEPDLSALKYYHFTSGRIAGIPVVISRTGYTGEDGFEIFLPSQEAPEAWEKVMAAGAPLGIRPVGLGARDTLRLEMRYVLYGNDIDSRTDPLEAGLDWITKLEKGDFIGREAIRRRCQSSRRRRLVAFELQDRGIARTHYSIWAGERRVGEVTSGTYSPSLRKGIGLGYVPVEFSRPGTSIEIEVRSGKLRAEVVRAPFYRQGSAKK